MALMRTHRINEVDELKDLEELKLLSQGSRNDTVNFALFNKETAGTVWIELTKDEAQTIVNKWLESGVIEIKK